MRMLKKLAKSWLKRLKELKYIKFFICKKDKMNLKVLRFSSQSDSTSGLLFVEHSEYLDFLCYTLEDEHRNTKTYGDTRIPSGTYKISLRTVGGMHEKYKQRFPDIHKGMLWIQDVPNFEYILIHCGNTDKDTAGCLLLGDSQKNNIIYPKGFVGSSAQAYKRIYPLITEALEKGKEVTIQLEDINNYSY